MKKNTSDKIRRICAGGLAALIMFMSIPAEQPVFASPENINSYTVIKIESVPKIAVKYGTAIEKTGLPETLHVSLIEAVNTDSNDSKDTTEAFEEMTEKTETSAAITPVPDSEAEEKPEITPTVGSQEEAVEADKEEKTETVNVLLPKNQAEPTTQTVEVLLQDDERNKNSDEESEMGISADIPVDWSCDNYDSKIPGTYTFQSSFKNDSYENHKLILADGITMPELIITVAEESELVLTQDIDDINITLKADAGVFPANAVLFVEKIEDEDKVEKIEQSINDTIAQDSETSENEEEPKTVEKTYSYDIKVLDAEDKELQPDNEKGNVTVSFANIEIPTEAGEEKSIEVYHVDDTLESAEAVTTEVKADEKTVEIIPEHFSIYVVTISGASQLRYFRGPNGNTDSYYMISTAAELAAFGELVNGTKTGTVLVYTETGTSSTQYTSALNKNAKLMNDITGVTNWIPIGNETYPYTATFDGDGHSISIDSMSAGIAAHTGNGIFGYLKSGAVIKNLTAKGTINASGQAFVAGIAGYVYDGTITNCNNHASITGTQFVGGIVGYHAGGSLTTCENRGTITGTYNSDAYIGGICGRNGAGQVVDRCSNTGLVTSNANSSDIGGIAGSNLGTVQNCYNGGTITANDGSQVGGIVGWNDKSSSVIQNCYNWGAITGNSSVGGINGCNNGTVQGVYNIAQIIGKKTGDNYVGGIVGSMFGGTIYYAHNRGAVTSSGTGTGGIVGGNWNGMSAPISLTCCWNEGTVGGGCNPDGYFLEGGIIGICGYNATNTLYMNNCYNKGMLQGSYYDHWTTIGTSPNYVGNGIGWPNGYATTDGKTIYEVTGGWGNSVYDNMYEFYLNKGQYLALMPWNSTYPANPSLNGIYGTTTVTSTEVIDRPYYTYENSVVRVYANGYQIVVHGFNTGETTTGVYWDKNSNGTYDSGDTAVALKNGTGSCLYSSGTTMYIYGGGEGINYSSSGRISNIYMESGKVNAIFGGGNGASVYGATINVKGGTVGDIYASALNYNMSCTSAIYIRGGTVTGTVKGQYNSSSTVGYCSVTFSGAPTVSGSVDLSTFTDKYARIDGTLTGSAGSIKLTNPSSTAENTNVVYSSNSSYTNANVFSLSPHRLRAATNYVQIKNYFDQTVSVKIDGGLADITSVYKDTVGLYVKSTSSSTYLPVTKTATEQYKATNLATGTSYNLYYKKGTSYIQIPGITCSESSNTATLDYVSIKNELTNMSSSNTDIAARKASVYASAYTTTLASMQGYELPATITVTRNGSPLTVETDYTYNQQTGALTIPSDKLTGAIKIKADAVSIYTQLTITEGKAAGESGATQIVDFLNETSKNSGWKLIPGKDYYLNVTLNPAANAEYIQVKYGQETYNGVTFANIPGGTFTAGDINHTYFDKLIKYTDLANPAYGSSTARLALTDGTLIYHINSSNEQNYAKFSIGLNINDAVYNGSGTIAAAIEVSNGSYSGSTYTGVTKSVQKLSLKVDSKHPILTKLNSTTATAELGKEGSFISAYVLTNNTSDKQAAAIYDSYSMDVTYPKNARFDCAFNSTFLQTANATYGTIELGAVSDIAAVNGIAMCKRTITVKKGYKALNSTVALYFRLSFDADHFTVGKYTMTLSNPALVMGSTTLNPSSSNIVAGNMVCTYTVTKGGTDLSSMSAINRPDTYNQTLDMAAGSYLVPFGSVLIRNGSSSSDSPYEKTYEAQFNTTNAAANTSMIMVPLGTLEEPIITWYGKDESGTEKSGTLTQEQVKQFAYLPGNVAGSNGLMIPAKELGIVTFTKVTAQIGCIRKGYTTSGWTSGWNFSYNYAGSYGYFTTADTGIVVSNEYHLYNTDEAIRDMTNGDLLVSTTATSTNVCREGMNAGTIKLGTKAIATDSAVKAGEVAKITGSIYPYSVPRAAYHKVGSMVIYSTATMMNDISFYLSLPNGITPKNDGGGIAFSKTTYTYSGRVKGTEPINYSFEQVGNVNNGITTYRITLDSNVSIGYYDADGNYSTLSYTLSFNTSESLSTQRYRLNDLIDVVCGNHATAEPYANVNSGTLVYAGEDTYNVNNGNNPFGVTKDYDDLQIGFGVQQLADIVVFGPISVSYINGTTVKEEDREWYIYNESNPSSIAMLGQNSQGQIHLTLENTSDNNGENLTLVLPIPQKDSNLGSLFMKDTQGFTVDMTAELVAGSSSGFTISYGKINGTYSESANFFATAGNYTTVGITKETANALVIKAASLPKGMYDLYLNYSVSNGDVDATDIWRPVYQYTVSSDTRVKTGGFIASAVAGSRITGIVFKDSNGDGIKQTGEAGIAGVTVTAKDVQGRNVSTVTDANGQYAFEAVREAVVTITFAIDSVNSYRFNVNAKNEIENAIVSTVVPEVKGLSATKQLYVSGTGNTINAAVSDFVKVQYNGNGSIAGNLPTVQEYVEGETATVSVKADNLVKKGYRFVGWNTQVDGNGTTYQPGNTFTVNEDTILYAKWELASYLITFNYRGATGENTQGSKTLAYYSYYGGTKTGTVYSSPLPTPIKTGYTFKGWAVNATTTSVISNASRFTVGTNQILYAVWTERADYTVNYDAQGGTDVANQTVKYTGTVIPVTEPTKAGYHFKAWKYNNVEVNDTDTFSRLAGTEETITLVAVWEAKTGYKVVYDTDGGMEILVAKTDVSWTDSSLLPSGNVTKPGYVFEGWLLSGTTQNVEDTDSYASLAGSDTVMQIILTAKWTELADNMIKYNTMGGTTIKDKNGVKADDANLLPTQNPEKAGYSFNGWKCGSKRVTNETIYSSLGDENSITLNAQWIEKQYTVTYDTTITETVVDKNFVWTNDNLIPETALTKTGYDFAGWYYGDTKISYNTTVATLIPADVVTGFTLTAHWTEKTYTVIYNADGGTYFIPKTKVNYTANNILPDASPIKKGYDFAGWFVGETEVTNTTKLSEVAAYEMAGKVTLKAKWTPKAGYSISYNTNSGTTLSDKINVTWDSEHLFEDKNTTRAGYTFTGWLVGRKNVAETTTYGELASEDTEGSKITLVAQWHENDDYSIIYHTECNAAIEDKTGVRWTERQLLPGVSLSKTGYAFVGWTLDSETEGKAISDITILKNTDSYETLVTGNENAKSIDVYAVWDVKKQYIVSYDTNGGGSIADRNDVAWIDKQLLPVEIPKKAGYQFTGWYCGGVKVVNASIFSQLAQDVDTVESITLTAGWDSKTYTVNYETGTTQTIEALTGITWVQEGILPSVKPVKEGYTFAGWSYNGKQVSDTDCMQTIVDDTVSASTSVTLQTLWTINHYAITIPEGTAGYEVLPINGSKAPTDYLTDYSFTVEIADGYSKLDDFGVYALKSGENVNQEQLLETDANGGYVISEVKADMNILVKGVSDITSPEGEIVLGTNHWNKFWNKLSFGLFFNNTQSVTINSTDIGSGIQEIGYYIADHELEQADVIGLGADEWNHYNNSFNINPDVVCVIYAKIADNAGNTSYINSNGVILDQLAPVISGIENGGHYFGNQTISVQDDYLRSLILNDEDITSELENETYVLEEPTSGTKAYTLVATDRAGNITTYSIDITHATYDLSVTAPIFTDAVYGYGTIAEGVIKLQSEGNQDTTVTSVTLSGTDAADFELNKTDGCNVTAGTENSTSYKVSPKSGLTAGTYLADITVACMDGQTITKPISFTVSKRVAVLSWPVLEFTYTGEKPHVTAEISNLVTGDECEVTVSVADEVIPETYTNKAEATALSNVNYELPNNTKASYSIKNATITGISITPYTGLVDTNAHNTIKSITGILDGDTVQYSTSTDGITWSALNMQMPQITVSGVLQVKVMIHREYYDDYEQTVTSEVFVGPTVMIGIPTYDSTDTSKIKIKGSVAKGDFDIAEQKFMYRKVGDSNWITINTIGTEALLSEMEAGTVYEFKLTAKDSRGNATEAYRKVLTNSENVVTGKIEGSVTGEGGRTFAVTLEMGNTIVSSIEGLHQNATFSFCNLPDGEYNLVATDGIYKVTRRVTVKEGKTAVVGLVTIGTKQTTVEVTQGAAEVAVDGLNELFTAGFFTENTQARDSLMNGGTVEIKLKSNVVTDSSNKNLLDSEANKNNKLISIYVDLTVDMIITPNGGASTTINISDTEQPILIAIPLEESARGRTGYRLYRNHNGNVQELPILEESERVNPTREGFYIEGDYVYVAARYFSSYALAYNKPINPVPNDDEKTDSANEQGKITSLLKLATTVSVTQQKVEVPQTIDNKNDIQQEIETTEKSSRKISDADISNDNKEEVSKQEQNEKITDFTDKNKLDDSESGQCNEHWYMLLLMSIFILFIMLGKMKTVKTVGIAFSIDIILTIILVIVGSCNLDIPFAVGTLLAAGVSVPIKKLMC